MKTLLSDRLCGVGAASAYKKIELSQKTKQEQMLNANKKEEKFNFLFWINVGRDANAIVTAIAMSVTRNGAGYIAQ